MAITLARPELGFSVDWAGEEWLADTVQAVRIGLYRCAADAAEAARADPNTPERTRAMRQSIRVAPPGYSENDTPLVRGGRFAPDALDLGPRSRDRSVGMLGQPGFQQVVDANGGEHRAYVQEEGSNLHVWVGSFVNYAYYQHQGFVHYQSRTFVQGYPYIVKHAEPALSRFDGYFRAAWPDVRYGGA